MKHQSCTPQLWIEPTTPVSTLSSNLLVCGMTPNLLSHTSQDDSFKLLWGSTQHASHCAQEAPVACPRSSSFTYFLILFSCPLPTAFGPSLAKESHPRSFPQFPTQVFGWYCCCGTADPEPSSAPFQYGGDTAADDQQASHQQPGSHSPRPPCLLLGEL